MTAVICGLRINQCDLERVPHPLTRQRNERYTLPSFRAGRPESPHMDPGQKTVLCIDDYKTSAAGWCLYLQTAGYAVETAYDPQEGLQLFATSAVDLVLLDYSMPEMNGGEVAATMKHMKPDVPIVMLSGVSEIPQGCRACVDAVIVKGEQPIVVLQKIEELLNRPERAA